MKMKLLGYLKSMIVLVLLLGLGWGFVNFYSYIFSRKVVGVIEKVERVDLNVSLLQQATASQKVSSDLFSFAVAIKEDTGEIVTASSEDRQWAVAKQGQCVEARYYPYPPWKLDKSGTYFGARLLKLTDCR